MYERQLAPVMARETKQKSEASCSNTIKLTGYVHSFVRVCRKEVRSRKEIRGRGNKGAAGTMASASHREPMLPLLFAAVRRVPVFCPPLSLYLSPSRLFHCTFRVSSFFLFFFSFCLSPLTTPRYQLPSSDSNGGGI